MYTGQPRVEDLDRLVGALRELLARRDGGRVGVFTFIMSGFDLPGADLRKRGAELQAEMTDSIRASAVVLDGAGFWVSAAISLVSTIQLVARPRNPSRIFRDMDVAAAWFSGHTGVPADELVAMTRRLHAEPGPEA